MQQVEKIPDIFRKANMEIKTIDVVMTKNPFLNKQELVEWFIGTLSANWDVPPEKRQVFFEDLADKHITAHEHMWESGLVYFEFPKVDIIAYKKR